MCESLKWGSFPSKVSSVCCRRLKPTPFTALINQRTSVKVCLPISEPAVFVDSCVLQWCVGTLAPALHYKAKGWDNKLQVHCWQAAKKGWWWRCDGGADHECLCLSEGGRRRRKREVTCCCKCMAKAPQDIFAATSSEKTRFVGGQQEMEAVLYTWSQAHKWSGTSLFSVINVVHSLEQSSSSTQENSV